MIKNNLSRDLCPNWIGNLNLNFSLAQSGVSVLTRCSHFGPFLVQKSFYPDSDKKTPHVYLLHPPGGLVGGDQLKLNVTLESDSRAVLTTPGSTKFYCTNGMRVSQKYIFKLARNAVLEWIPQSSIFFPKSKAKIDNIFILDTGSRVIAFDMFCFGNAQSDTYLCPEEIDIFLRISVPNFVGFRDRLQVNELNFINKLGSFRISAMLFAIPANKKILDQVRVLMNSFEYDDQIGGATLLEHLLIVRLLGNDNQNLKKVLHCIWSAICPDVVGKKSVVPRIWLT